MSFIIRLIRIRRVFLETAMGVLLKKRGACRKLGTFYVGARV
jgi:hypothetical protein